MESYLYTFAHKVLLDFHGELFTSDELQFYADKVQRKGCVLERVYAFLDGFHWEICRPGGANMIQRPFFSGYCSRAQSRADCVSR